MNSNQSLFINLLIIVIMIENSTFISKKHFLNGFIEKKSNTFQITQSTV